ncbi:hypothetical protein EDC01DRAFT_719557 [Geopyxis carbonaria]|nr:hypothetical protein EDC01DRAFT_719557 [Geopyxis carbonaria]
MFRGQQNQFDDVVVKATDENLTSENWEFMMDAWEKVNSSGDGGFKDAVAALIKRLAHRNANVQLYTIELANGFTQNCGPKMHQELASRAFTEALLRLASDRTTHQAVKAKILEKMAEWVAMFSSDPGLGIMEQAFHKLKSQNPNFHPPSKPHKQQITEVDRQKEEEELQMALAISLKERPNNGQASGSAQKSQTGSGQAAAQTAPQPTPVPHTTAATVSRVRALYDFVPSESGELAFRKGDIIAVLESVYKDWWKGSLRGQTGIFPLNYVEKLSDPTTEELQKDAQMESEVFGQIKNVEKLLALLSTSEGNSSVQDNEEITTLYHSTLAIRPKLIELIGKYSQKKDDFVALNEKFIKARRDYESLLESSMSQTAAAHYGRPPTTNPYTYPPTDAYPPTSEPGQYYTPGPGNNSSASPPTSGAYPPPQGKPYGGGGRPPSNTYYPQQHHEAHEPHQGGSAPFYVVGQAPPGSQIPGRGDSPSTSAAGYSSPAPQHHHQQKQHQQPPTQSDGNAQPQELATSIYDTPIESTSNSSFPAPKRNSTMTPSQPPGAPYSAVPAGYQPYASHQPRPHSTGYPTDPPPISPNVQPAHPYPQLGNSSGSTAPPAGMPYQKYPPGPATAGSPRPQSYYTPHASQPPQEPPQPSGTPQDYYRQSELFLPPGSRAQG